MHNQLLDSQKGHTNMHLHEGEIWLKWSGNNLADKYLLHWTESGIGG